MMARERGGGSREQQGQRCVLIHTDALVHSSLMIVSRYQAAFCEFARPDMRSRLAVLLPMCF